MSNTDPANIRNIPGMLPSFDIGVPLPTQVLDESSLVAAAKRLTDKTRTNARARKTLPWQDEAWEMFDLVGEQQFLATTLAGRLAQASLYVGHRPVDLQDDPEPTEDTKPVDLLNSLGSRAEMAQMIERLAINLFVAGEGWLVGVPPEIEDSGASDFPSSIRIDPAMLSWHMLSVQEVSRDGEDRIKVTVGDRTISTLVDNLWLIRVWHPHPRKAQEATSPTRSCLPILRELVGLTMHISAQVDSRLAGAGLLVVPQSAQAALAARNFGVSDGGDEFTEALIEAMITPIQNRDSAAALVPLVITVPDEVTGAFQHLTFTSPLDGEARSLREEAIRRLALSQDAPPEVLLGTGGMNHWGAWLVQEDVVTTHIEPRLALICEALTTEFLWPVLIEQGMEEEKAHEYVIWYDISDLIVRPNHSQDAAALHDKGLLTDSALRRELGFDETDAPEETEELGDFDPVVSMALDIVRGNPSLLSAPGLPSVVAQLRKVLSGEATSTAPVSQDDPDEEVTETGEIVEAPGVSTTTAAPPNLPATSANPAAVPGFDE